MEPNQVSRMNPFDKWAATYDQSITQPFFFGPIQAAMLDLVGRQMSTSTPTTILDIGCGTGRLLRSAANRWPGACLFGLDVSAPMIAEASRRMTNATLLTAPAEAIPLPDTSIDLALSSLSFHHWTDQLKSLSEIARVLRPGGYFCLADQTPPAWVARRLRSNTNTLEGIRAKIQQIGLVGKDERFLLGRFVSITITQKPVHR
jgi:ubiquinone/menaquinone biosynthesis C-methylase UbiE